MKNIRRGLALLLTTALLLISLSGCNALIERDRLVITPHQIDLAPPQDNGDFVIINSQQELERIMRNMVRVHAEQGLFRIDRFSDYGIETIIADAVREVQTDPLVAYVGSVFMHSILSDGPAYTELELTISYQRTVEQVVDIRTVHSTLGAATLLEWILRDGETYLAMLAPATVVGVGHLERIIQDIYYFSRVPSNSYLILGAIDIKDAEYYPEIIINGDKDVLNGLFYSKVNMIYEAF